MKGYPSRADEGAQLYNIGFTKAEIQVIVPGAIELIRFSEYGSVRTNAEIVLNTLRNGRRISSKVFGYFLENYLRVCDRQLAVPVKRFEGKGKARRYLGIESAPLVIDLTPRRYGKENHTALEDGNEWTPSVAAGLSKKDRTTALDSERGRFAWDVYEAELAQLSWSDREDFARKNGGKPMSREEYRTEANRTLQLQKKETRDEQIAIQERYLDKIETANAASTKELMEFIDQRLKPALERFERLEKIESGLFHTDRLVDYAERNYSELEQKVDLLADSVKKLTDRMNGFYWDLHEEARKLAIRMERVDEADAVAIEMDDWLRPPSRVTLQ